MSEHAERLPDNRDVWRIALPMILSNITVPLLGMVDTGVTGHLESEIYLAAVAIGATVFSVLYTGVNFLRMGTTGIAAQAYGARDYTALRTSLGQAVAVALASVIAEYSGAAVGGAFVLGTLRRHPGKWLVGHLTDLREYGAFFAVNANLFVRTLALMFTISFVTAQGARMGGTILAANALLMNLQNLTAFALDGIAHAAEALVGKAIGAKRRDALVESVRLTLRWSLGFALALALIYVVLGPVLIRVLTDLPDIRTTAMRYLPWLIVSPVISVWSFLYDGVYVGATRAREMRNIMVASAVVFLGTWYVTQGFGNDGLWFAFMVFLGARGLGMHLFYKRSVLPLVIAKAA